MARTFSSFAKRFFIFLNILAAFFFLLACLAPYVNPEKWWLISFAGLGFAIAFLVQILFIITWLVFRSKYVLISLLVLIIGWKSISVFFAFHTNKPFNHQKPKDVLRVVHWNVARFVEWSRNNNKGSRTRLKMFEQLKAQHADVLCLVEFYHSTEPEYYDNITPMMKELGYPYFYFSWDQDGGKQWAGQAIFSKHPFIDTGIIRFPPPTMPEAMIHADIKFNEDTIRIYTTHLQSVRFKKNDYESIEKIKKRDDSLIQNSKNIVGKLKSGFIYRSRQAHVVAEQTSHSPYPFILTGDFNDVPNSYAYFTISHNLQDAFLEKGLGVGRTFSYISPTLRIDYILATKDFRVQQFNRIVKNYSDHYMIVADFKLTH